MASLSLEVDPVVMSLQAEDGLPAVAGGEQEEHHSRSPGPGRDRRHQGGHGALQDAVHRGAAGRTPRHRAYPTFRPAAGSAPLPAHCPTSSPPDGAHYTVSCSQLIHTPSIRGCEPAEPLTRRSLGRLGHSRSGGSVSDQERREMCRRCKNMWRKWRNTVRSEALLLVLLNRDHVTT